MLSEVHAGKRNEKRKEIKYPAGSGFLVGKNHGQRPGKRSVAGRKRMVQKRAAYVDSPQRDRGPVSAEIILKKNIRNEHAQCGSQHNGQEKQVILHFLTDKQPDA